MNITKIVSVALAATFGFKLAAPAAELAGLSFAESFLALSLGGLTSSLILYFAFERSIRFYRKQFAPKPHVKRTKKIFTKRNRLIIRTIQKYGIVGVAAITPPLLSIPVGCFILARLNVRFFNNSSKIIIYLTASILIWALLLSALVHIITIPSFLK